LRANYPLALDAEQARVISVFRHPAHLHAYEMNTGRALNGGDVCGDSDDVFVDAERHRVYVICGQGVVETFDSSSGAYKRIGEFTTSAGSRTGLFVADLDRLFVAIRAAHGEPAAIWVLRPTP
jgi:hypothetical protein